MGTQSGGGAKASPTSRENCKFRVPDPVICTLKETRAGKIRG